jgi:hypothetical protein
MVAGLKISDKWTWRWKGVEKKDVEVLNFEEKTYMVSLNEKVTTEIIGDKMEGYKCWETHMLLQKSNRDPLL